MPDPAVTLPSLPPELLDRIVAHLPLAAHMAALAATSRSLAVYVATGGWAAFAARRFPAYRTAAAGDVLLQATGGGAATVRALTAAARNADRRGLRAGEVRPGRAGRTVVVDVEEGTTNGTANAVPASTEATTDDQGPHALALRPRPSTSSPARLVRALPAQPWRPPRGQTMGFVPCVSAVSTPAPAGLARREDMLAYGAGAEVLLLSRAADGRSCRQRWTSYRPPGAVEGRDDVTSVQVLDTTHAGRARVLVGTAAGRLETVTLRTEGDAGVYDVLDTNYTTMDRGVRHTALLGQSGLFSAVLGQDTLALYAPSSPSPVSSIPAASGPRSQAWRTSFLSPTAVGVTLSAAREPIHIYTLLPSGLSAEPTTRIALHASEPRTVYPLEPLPGTDGRVLASGGYDGVVRVHDVRCAGQGAQLAARDMADYGTIYSLLPRSGHHLLAGTAQFDLLSVLDLRAQGFMRVPLSRVEDSIRPEGGPGEEVRGFDAAPRGAYEYGGTMGSYYLYLRDRGTRFEGPVYSLSSPSEYSPFVYAGLENSVVQICFDGAADASPDPVVRTALDAMAEDWMAPETRRARQKKGKKPEPQSGWEMNLKAVDHGSLVVREQRSVAEAKSRGPTFAELDERW